MRCFTPLLAAVITVAQLASRLRVDVEHRILATNAQKSEVNPGALHPWQGRWAWGIGPLGIWDDGRPADLASPAAVPGRRTALASWAATSLTAARWSHLFAGKNGRQPSMEGTNKVLDGIAAKAELELAKAALDEAWATSGASEKGLLTKAFAAVNSAQAAMDSTLSALDAAQAAMDDDQAALADAAMGAVGAAMENTRAAMDNAQAAFETLLRTSEMASHMLGQAKMQNAERFQAAIIAAAGALRNARSEWWYDVEESMVPVVEAVSKQEATEAETVASTEAVNEASMAVGVAAKEAANEARMAGIVAAEMEAANKERSRRESKLWQDELNKAGMAGIMAAEVEAANKERTSREAKLWQDELDKAGKDK